MWKKYWAKQVVMIVSKLKAEFSLNFLNYT